MTAAGFWRRPIRPSGLLPTAAVLLLFPFSALAQTPTVARLVPAFGPASGNNVVIVSGTGFAAGATVTFGGAPATSVNVVNATSLTAKPPTHAAGLVTGSVPH